MPSPSDPACLPVTKVSTPTPGSCCKVGREAVPRPDSGLRYCWKNFAPAALPVPGPLEEL